VTASKSEWRQFEVKLLKGAEPWVLIRHRSGAFKLPLDCSIEEMLRGVTYAWSEGTRPSRSAVATVRIPLHEFLAKWASE
jgi:hypothetical protein